MKPISFPSRTIVRRFPAASIRVLALGGASLPALAERTKAVLAVGGKTTLYYPRLKLAGNSAVRPGPRVGIHQAYTSAFVDKSVQNYRPG
jgi:hypothetical protein